MEYQEFLLYTKKCIADFMGESFQVSINHVEKNNGVILDGLVIMGKEQNISPTIYMEPFFDSYCKGKDVSQVVKEIIEIYERHIPHSNIDIQFFRDYKMVEKKIVYRLVNYGKNEKMLKKVPHRRLLDMAVVCHCLVVSEETGSASIMIHSDHLDMWGISEEELFEAAKENTQRLLRAEISGISRMMRDVVCEDVLDMMRRLGTGRGYGPDKEKEFMEVFSGFLDGAMGGQEAEGMYVLTNHLKINGAACMIYPDVLRDFADSIGTDLYILPSSVHEVMLVPIKEGVDPYDLNRTLVDVNRKEVDEQEILSDSVYYYDRHDDKLHMI